MSIRMHMYTLNVYIHLSIFICIYVYKYTHTPLLTDAHNCTYMSNFTSPDTLEICTHFH